MDKGIDGRCECDCKRRRLKVMKEPECQVEDIRFSSAYNGKPRRGSLVYLVR